MLINFLVSSMQTDMTGYSWNSSFESSTLLKTSISSLRYSVKSPYASLLLEPKSAEIGVSKAVSYSSSLMPQGTLVATASQYLITSCTASNQSSLGTAFFPFVFNFFRAVLSEARRVLIE